VKLCDPGALSDKECDELLEAAETLPENEFQARLRQYQKVAPTHDRLSSTGSTPSHTIVFNKERTLRDQKGQIIHLDPIRKDHLAVHVVPDTRKAFETVQQLRHQFQYQLNRLRTKISPNSKAAAKITELYKTFSKRTHAAQGLDQFLLDCLQQSSANCPSKALITQYYQRLEYGKQRLFESEMIDQLVKTSKTSLIQNWRKIKETTIAPEKVTEALLERWEKHPELLKIINKDDGMIEIRLTENNQSYVYRAIVCTSPSTHGTPCKKNSVLTLYPKCGPDVLKLPELHPNNLAGAAAEFVPCP
jgi:hypothetical protein